MTAARRDGLRALLTEVDALLVTDLLNVRYLTGFTGSNAALLVRADGRDVLATDGRYTIQAAAEAPDVELVVDRACAVALTTAADVARLGFESDAVTVEAHATLADAAGATALLRAPGLVAGLRAVKDATEVALLRTACAAADAALADLVAAGGLAPGRTEREVALDLEDRMRGHGADGPSFETIVAAGAHAAIPHHRPTAAPLTAGDLVVLDFGALVGGYHSDMTRTVVLGTAAGWQRDLYALVDAAAAAGRAALAPGAEAVAVDAAARDVCVAAGYGEQFPHGLGHGVGLQIHEAPAVSWTATGTLAAGMAVTVEPGVYLEGRGGVRIEDLLVVRDGAGECLTGSPRELLEI